MSMGLSDNTSKPLYEQVGELIRSRLVQNVYRPGTALPSEIQLAGELGVSQGTVRKAINDLVGENILYRRQGLGTFVAEHTETSLLSLYFNVARDDGKRTLPVNKVLSFRRHTASREEREKLTLGAGAKVFRVDRLRSFEDDVMMVESLSIPFDRFPSLADEPLPNHLYRYYQAKYGVSVAKARERLKAVAATAEQAQQLGVKAGDPLLLIDRIALTIEGIPVEWRRSYCKTDAYHFHVDRG